jgi:hypothetical protein
MGLGQGAKEAHFVAEAKTHHGLKAMEACLQL